MTIAASSTNAQFNLPLTDYSLADQEMHVWSEAMQPIDLVNSILCFTKQMRADNFINAGPYAVLADEAMCFDEDGSQGSSNTPTYLRVIVTSVQPTPSSPLTVSAWIPGMGVGDDEEAIKFKAIIYEGATEENPYGNFTFNYEFFDSIDDLSSTGGGEIQTINNIGGKIGFTIYDSSVHDSNNTSQSASVIMNADRTEGNALTASSWGVSGQAYALSFNETHVLQQSAADYSSLPYKIGNNTGSCFSRTSFDDAVRRYDLYDSVTGELIEINSGFPIRYDSDNDTINDSWGHVGYWGLWTEDEDFLDDGDTVVAEDPNGGPATNYTVVKAPGRLIKYSLETLPLAESRSIGFWYWGDDPGSSSYDIWLVNYLTIADDGVLADGFYRVAGLNWQQDGPPNASSITPVQIVLATDEILYMSSEELGGEVRFKEGATAVSFYRETFINGSEVGTGELLAGGSIQLRCFDHCFKGSLTGPLLQDYDGANGPFDNPVANVASAITYTFDTAGGNPLTLVRNDNSQAVAFDNALTSTDLANSPHLWGVRSGPMVTPDVVLTEPEDVHDSGIVSEFYVWEAGINPWNQLRTVKDGSNVIPEFDPPLQFTYEHSDANDRSGSAGVFDGRSVMLNYGGNGDLWGIPKDFSGSNHLPLFNLIDGALLGASNEYVVKAREIEQMMADATGQCGSMTLTDPLVAVPASIQGSANIGAMPVVVGAPSVIAGELQ